MHRLSECVQQQLRCQECVPDGSGLAARVLPDGPESPDMLTGHVVTLGTLNRLRRGRAGRMGWPGSCLGTNMAPKGSADSGRGRHQGQLWAWRCTTASDGQD